MSARPSFWTTPRVLLILAVVLCGAWIIWEVTMRVRDVVEIGTAAED